jgi:heptosyltransferase-2
MELAVLPEHRESAANVWRRLQIPADRPVVALNAGGAYGAAKHWPAEHCGALAARIARRHDRTVLVLCGPAEAEAARDVVRIAADARVVSLADIPTSIGESKACIARCSLMISTDSGPRHMAVALGVPTIALFGPTDPRWSESYADHATSLWHDVPCGPCHRRVCPEGHHRCMRDLTVDRVMAEVTRRLEQERRDAA